MELLIALWNVVIALWGLLAATVQVLLPWLPLIAWVAFWLGAVNWKKLSPILLERGGIVGVALIALMAILVWGTVAPPAGGVHYIAGLTLSNFVGKTVYVTTLAVIAFLCGSVQVSGCCDFLFKFQESEPAAEHAPHDVHH